MTQHLTMAALLSLSLSALLQPVEAAEEVNVYSYRQPFLVEPIFDSFTRETGIEVNVVFAKKGLIERLKREGRNSPADLMLTTDIGRLNDLVEGDLVQPAVSDALHANIPAAYREPDGLWFGLTVRARIAVVSEARVSENALLRYEDLADPRWRGRVCSRSGKHVYSVALVASMIAANGDAQTREWLSAVKANLARKPQGNDRGQVKAISEGGCDVALINNYYMGNMLADPEQAVWADSVRIVFPNQADRGTHVNLSGVALTRHAPNKDNAIRLMEFLSDDQAQAIYAEVNYEYPVKPGVPWSPLLESWGRFKIDPIPLSKIAALRRDAVKMVDESGFDD
jgi:iron(III) transport system substrate-binding protein